MRQLSEIIQHRVVRFHFHGMGLCIKSVITVCVLLMCSQAAYAQIFTQSAAQIEDLRAAAAAWGDVDNDGDLDLAIAGLDDAGQAVTRIYNNAGGTLTEDPAHQITGIMWGDLAWGDFDNDGAMDLAINGQGQGSADAAGVSEVYRNIGGVLLLDPTQLVGPSPFFEVTPLRYGSVAWADHTNDGRLDLAIAGIDQNGFVLVILYENRNNILTEDQTQSIVAARNGALTWGDFNGDGLPDLAVTGLNSDGVRISRFYLNHSGRFVEASGVTLPALSGGDMAWGDYDGDGLPDLAVSGWDEYWNAVLKIYRNNGLSGAFDEAFVLEIAGNGLVGALAWGDYDADGDADLAVAGRDAFTNLSTAVFVNNNGTSFSAANELALGGVMNGDLAWGDYNNDGRLDLLVAGEQADGTPLTVLYTNNGTANTAPDAPVLKASVVTEEGILLQWDAGADTETPVAGLTYNVRLGATPGGHELISASAQGDAGPGNTGAALMKRLEFPVTVATLYWSVQTVDTGFERSAFTDEETIEIQRLVHSEQQLIGLRQSLIGRGAAWGDYDNDGWIDLAIAGININGIPKTFLYRNVAGVFALDTEFSIEGLENGALAWGDYDNDGDLDLFRSGNDRFGNAFTYLYNNTDGTLTRDTDQEDIESDLNLTESHAAWGDYNNDGGLDLAINGKDRSNIFRTYLYKNTGGGHILMRDTDQSLTGTVNGDLAWGDLDNDGDLDLIISGEISGSPFFTLEVYRNTEGILTRDTAQNLPGYLSSSMALGDSDGDGDLDLAVNGGTGTSFITPTFKLYTNDGTGVFAETQSESGTFAGSVMWGDYDNDGDLDLMLTGQDAFSDKIARIYRNDAGTLVETTVDILPGLVFSTAGWADYDNDGDLDLVMTGAEGDDQTALSRVFDNITGRTTPNTPPGAPTDLNAHISGNTATLTWDEGADAETAQAGLTYILRAGTASGRNDLVSGVHAPGIGKLGHARAVPLDNLPVGIYYWAVQTVDAGLSVSVETSEQQFIVGSPGDVAGGSSGEGDGVVNVLDVIRIIQYIIDAPPDPESENFNRADLNNDGRIDVLDVVTLVNIILAPGTPSAKTISDGPVSPVTVHLEASRQLKDGRYGIPISVANDGVVAAMEATFTFDPDQIETGTPYGIGRAEALSIASKVKDGMLRLVVYSADGRGIAPGEGTVAVIPLRLKENATRTPTLVMNHVMIADRQARAIPVTLATIRRTVISPPDAFALGDNHPNPFNPSTTISYQVPQQAHVTITLHNLLGQEVVRLVDEVRTPGRYEVVWNGRNARGQGVASGIYLYRMRSNTGFSLSKRMVLVK